MTVLADNPRGTLIFDGNELFVISKINDPSKVRLRAPASQGVKGALSFDTQRQDGGYEEIAYISGKQDERVRDDPYDLTGCVEVFIRRFDASIRDDAQQQRTLTVLHDGVWSSVNLHPPVTPSASFLRSTDGRYELHIQVDGNVVLYDRGTPILARFGLPHSVSLTAG